MIRIGILGAARIAPKAVIEPCQKRDDVAITAIAARDIARARIFRDLHAPEAAATGYAELIARDDVDLVYIAGPPSTHAEWAVAALNAGKHVLLEKPSTLNAQQTRAVLAAVASSGRRCIEAFHYRYHPVIGRALDLVQSGSLGVVERIEAEFCVPIARSPDEFRWNAALGGGGLMDLGCYPLHWARTLMGSEPTITAAKGEFDAGVDVSMHADLAFSEDRTAQIHCSMMPEAGRFSARLKVFASNGSLDIMNPLAPQLGCRFTVTHDGITSDEETSPRPTYEFQLDAVIRGLAENTPLPTEGQDTLNQSIAIDAIYDAAKAPAH
jgi:predicted dehydrogenase